MIGLITFVATLVTIATVVHLVSRHWILGLSLVLLLFLSEAVAVSLPGFLLGSINVYPQDIVFLALGAAFILRFVMHRFSSVAQLCWAAFGLLVMVAFLRGVSLFGVKPSGDDARQFFYLFSGTAYFATFPMTGERWKRLESWWHWVAVALVLLALARWSAMFLELPFADSWEGVGGPNRFRVLNAAQTLLILQGLLLLRARTADHRAKLAWQLGSLFLIVVTLLQHRSVWVTGFFALMLQARLQRKPLRAFYITFLVVSLGCAVWTFSGVRDSALGRALEDSVGEPFGEESTMVWRIELWEQYLADRYLSTPLEWMLGRPFGSPYGSAFGSEITYGPHNYYVHLLLRLGLGGLLLQLIAWFLPFVRIHHFRFDTEHESREAAALRIVLATQFIFALVYSPSFEQGILFGSAMSFDALMRHDERVAGVSGTTMTVSQSTT